MKLSDFEMEVMQVIWGEGECVAPDIHRKILEERDVSYYSVKTIIDRLEEKGAVQRLRTYGRTILYGPLVDREEVTGPVVRRFIKRMFAGKALPLISHVLADEELSDKDLDRLEAMVARKRKQREDES